MKDDKQGTAVTVRGEKLNRSEAQRLAEEQIERRLARLEQLIEQLAAQRTDYRIHIEQLHVQHAVLEQMSVRLDQLDVGEVSGSLNIGNNFHTLKGLANSQGGSASEGQSAAGSGLPQTADGKADADTTPQPKRRPPANKRDGSLRTANGPSMKTTPNGFSYRFDANGPGGGDGSENG